MPCLPREALIPATAPPDPWFRQQMMDDLAMKAGILPGQPMYPQPAVSSLADFVPFELVQFAKDEITHAVSVTVSSLGACWQC